MARGAASKLLEPTSTVASSGSRGITSPFPANGELAGGRSRHREAFRGSLGLPTRSELAGGAVGSPRSSAGRNRAMAVTGDPAELDPL